MLDKEAIISKHVLIIQFMAKQSGKEIATIEKLITDIVVSHLELMDKDTNQSNLGETAKVEKKKELLGRAIEARICPDCSAPLLKCNRASDEVPGRFDITYECIGCNFIYPTTG